MSIPKLITNIFCLILVVQSYAQEAEKVKVESDGWELIGNLLIPEAEKPVPVVLLLNQAAGDRSIYKLLSEQLNQLGIASLRLDLRGHGESTNKGSFEPGKLSRDPMIWDAEVDVKNALEYLIRNSSIDGNKIGILGASYSGEEMAESGRLHNYVQAYVTLSPGSFSDESIAGIDESNTPWFFIVSKNETYLKEITAQVQRQSQSVELLILSGSDHATDLLESHPNLSKRIASWFAHQLK